MNSAFRAAWILSAALLVPRGFLVAGPADDRLALHAEINEKTGKAQAAYAIDDLEAAKSLHLEVLELRKKTFSADDYSEGHPDIWASYAAIARVMLDLDPVAGEAYCREALRQRPTPGWRRSEEYASTLMLWGEYLDRLHEGSFAEVALLDAFRIYEEYAGNNLSPFLTLAEHYFGRGDRDADAFSVLSLAGTSAPKIALRVENHSPDAVQVCWIGRFGKRNTFGTVEAGQRKGWRINAGVIHILIDSNGRIVGAADTESNPTVLQAHNPPRPTGAGPRHTIRLLHALGLNNLRQGNVTAAQLCFHEAAQVSRFAFGSNPAVAESLTHLAQAYALGGEADKALATATEASQAFAAFPSPRARFQVWEYRLADVYTRLGKSAEAADHAAKARKLEAQFRLNARLSPLVEVGGLSAEPIVNLRKSSIAQRLGHDPERRRKAEQARVFHSQGAPNRDLAKEFYPQEIEILKELYPASKFPNGHPVLAAALLEYAIVNEDTQIGFETLTRAFDMNLALFGNKHPRFATAARPLSRYLLEREPAKAMSILKTSIAICEAHGTDSAGFKLQLGHLYRSLSEVQKAERIYVEALESSRRSGDLRMQSYLLHHLNHMYRNQNRLAECEAVLSESIAIRRKAGNRYEIAVSLTELSVLHSAKKDFEKAVATARESIDLFQQLPSPETQQGCIPAYVQLGNAYQALGDLKNAEQAFSEALKVHRKRINDPIGESPEASPKLAILAAARGEFNVAEGISRKLLTLELDMLELSAATQTEATQFKSLSYRTPLYHRFLSYAVAANTPAKEVYPQVFRWKGLVTNRQRLMRFARQASSSSDENVARLFAELEATSRRYAALASNEAAATNKALADVAAQRDAIEEELSRQTDKFRRVRLANRASLSDLQRVLPRKAVLVDFAFYERALKSEKIRSLAAFVIGSESIDLIDLGPASQACADLELFMAAVQRGGSLQGADAVGSKLRKSLWAPLEAKFGEANTILISPDCELCSLPFAALPSAGGKRYLLEDYSIAQVLVPQMLPELLAQDRSAANVPSLFAVGDVDFDVAGSPSKAKTKPEEFASVRGFSEGMSWSHLPGTREETAGIEKLFHDTVKGSKLCVLRGKEATEAAFRAEAPGHTILHIATHGFYATGAAAEKAPPGLRAGIVFAGANRPDREGDDGILTALEAASLDLSKVDLAVLSACETTLGVSVAGGEGVVGLQRALQIAGAKTTCTSLWKVDDEATRRLMERFYENLWKKKLGTLAALREAQLWMLNEGRAALSDSTLRGIARLNPSPVPSVDRRLPPSLWAAFVLSGDWR